MDDPSHDLSYASWGAIFIVFSIGHLSTKGHHREIYLIWYINSLFFTLFYGLGIIAEQKNVRLTEVCGTYQENCKAVYEYLTNVQDELTLIAVVSALAIGPQLLTYILSALSGSASTPRFVSQIAKIAAWSFVIRCRFRRNSNRRTDGKADRRQASCVSRFHSRLALYVSLLPLRLALHHDR